MTLWHGFKVHAVNVARLVRRGLDLRDDEPMDVDALTRRYDADIAALSEIGCPTGAVEHFASPERSSLSGLVLPVDGRSLIVYNDHDSEERIRATFTHEASHLILQHEHVTRVSFGKDCTNPNLDQEEEAAVLGGELLIPLSAARQAALRSRPASDLAAQYAVSTEMAQWRMNMSGGSLIKKFARA